MSRYNAFYNIQKTKKLREQQGKAYHKKLLKKMSVFCPKSTIFSIDKPFLIDLEPIFELGPCRTS
jgi:hypothetical protein